MRDVGIGFVVALVVGPAVLALIAGMCWAAAVGRIQRNTAVGIRLPSMMAFDSTWRAGHRAAIVPAAASAVVLLVLDVVAVLVRGRGIATDSLILGLIVLLLLAIALIAVVAGRAARAVEDPTG